MTHVFECLVQEICFFFWGGVRFWGTAEDFCNKWKHNHSVLLSVEFEELG